MNSESTTHNTGHSEAEWKPGKSLAYQLERAKEDLELVSYVTSHDLQAPIRTIHRLCEELGKHANVMENSVTHDLVHNIRQETEHMKVLMHGVLDYMRLETYGPAHSLFPSDEIMAAALTVMEEKIRMSNARVTYDFLPQIYGHRGRITRLFVSLLDNALKFKSEKAPAIHITATPKGDWVEFCFSDNGIGIDEEYHNIIFGLFSRLHTAGEYPGDGIGLALCRKIVESHGGEIGVESVPDEGSRFLFTLPAVPIHP
jgi:light-regulated signal transduction histidine kinase (bacteriophytochrome)